MASCRAREGRDVIRWGIISTGGIASTFAADLAHTDSGSAVAVGSRRAASAEAFGERFGIPNRHDTYNALVEDPEVDAVYVGTPHPLHHEDALLALRAGKHVLVEKPFTMNAAEAEELVREARQRGLFLMEAMWARFLPHMREIRRLLADGVLGEIVTVTADHSQWFVQDASHRLFAPELGGGALLDLGIYPVSFAHMVLGTPDRVVALADPAFTGVDAQTSILLGYESGAHAALTCTLRALGPTRAAIVGTEGRIEIDGAFYQPTSFSLIPREGESQRMFDPPAEGGLRHEADEVARCIEAGELESPEMPLDETVSIMRTMDAVSRATAA
jgi:predicted dehydrogenase